MSWLLWFAAPFATVLVILMAMSAYDRVKDRD